MDHSYKIQVMTAGDRQRMVGWAAAEGWNPGAQDVTCFAKVDPQGFWAGWQDGAMISSISVVNYDPGFAFLGFYIVAPEWRGHGYGLQLWQHALAHAGDRVVGLDGVVDQLDNYRASGFELAYRNIRFGGVPGAVQATCADGVELRAVESSNAQLEALDRRVFPAPRGGFWKNWLQAQGHVSVQAQQGDKLIGFGTIRPCREGFKIGPLVVGSRQVAEMIVGHLLQNLNPQDQVFLDVPEPNGAAVAMAESFGLVPVFETARMYRGAAPELDLGHVFGVTSFELG